MLLKLKVSLKWKVWFKEIKDKKIFKFYNNFIIN